MLNLYLVKDQFIHRELGMDAFVFVFSFGIFVVRAVVHPLYHLRFSILLFYSFCRSIEFAGTHANAFGE